MKALKTSIIVALFSLVFTGISYGQSSERGGKKERPTFAKLLEEMDANEDGKLSESEVKGPLKENFSKIDTDEDGFISEKEFENAPKPERKKRQ
ncbi:EF-hand domain-containing protein [Aureibaculum marinum]|uniref:EF-hand domain-containing protein n=1 Tax=Aureibaculum marinum TaxID=2487930 RepID=A0A3N4NWQ0_9FLAO|nr:EF-hand domain-containing protein [Aureibaculum marinum]RPE00803.1 EF-hand domain-containing protein [Aureibaculum marinum]